jgi:hypothetical protein
MKSRSLLWITAAVCALSLDSLAQPAPSSSAGPKADPSGGAPANAKVAIPPWPSSREAFPAFDAEPFPAEKTKTPDDADWKKAVEVRLSRVSPGVPAACRAWRVREWMKIHCEIRTAGLRMLAGSREGVSFLLAPALPFDVGALARETDRDESEVRAEVEAGAWEWNIRRHHLETEGRFAQIVFPIRRGDRRVFEWLAMEVWEGYDGGLGVGSTSMMIVEEQWLEGEEPKVALLKR